MLYSSSPESKEKHLSYCRENSSLQIGQKVNKETWLELILREKVTSPHSSQPLLPDQVDDTWAMAGRR